MLTVKNLCATAKYSMLLDCVQFIFIFINYLCYKIIEQVEAAEHVPAAGKNWREGSKEPDGGRFAAD